MTCDIFWKSNQIEGEEAYSIIANNKLIKVKKVLYNFRRGMVLLNRVVQINVKTVLKWLKRYQRMGLAGLIDLPRSPKLIRNKLSSEKTELINNKVKRDNWIWSKKTETGA